MEWGGFHSSLVGRTRVALERWRLETRRLRNRSRPNSTRAVHARRRPARDDLPLPLCSERTGSGGGTQAPRYRLSALGNAENSATCQGTPLQLTAWSTGIWPPAATSALIAGAGAAACPSRGAARRGAHRIRSSAAPTCPGIRVARPQLNVCNFRSAPACNSRPPSTRGRLREVRTTAASQKTRGRDFCSVTRADCVTSVKFQRRLRLFTDSVASRSYGKSNG